MRLSTFRRSSSSFSIWSMYLRIASNRSFRARLRFTFNTFAGTRVVLLVGSWKQPPPRQP
ncbi:unnamed protein product, partial [Haemonchus placei]